MKEMVLTRLSHLRVLLCIFFVVSKSKGLEILSPDYGVDVSFPIHRYIEDKTSVFYERYQKTMAGCYKAFSKSECDATEHARMAMNLEQPKNQHNYTELGFKKTRVPDDLFKDILAFYEENKMKSTLENWPRGNTYVNNWDSPPHMVAFEDRSLRGGMDLKQRIWDGVKPIISEWTGKKLIDTSLYGIRVYSAGAILATHVDRMPLVSSAIIQVAQDIDEPWPVEVISHDGKAYNVSMAPGDMVLYESHSILHGRPFPLQGRLYANIFVHFIPVDHDEQNAKDKLREKVLTVTDRVKNALSGLSIPKKLNIGGHEQDNHDEEEVQRHRDAIEARAEEDAMEEEDAEEVVDEVEERKKQKLVDGMTALHIAAAGGDLAGIISLLKSFESGSISGSANYDMIHARDANDWQAVHEAAAGGHLEVLQYLVEKGADVGAMTKEGGTVLWWAKKALEEGDPVILYLEEIGAPDKETPMYP